MSALEQYSVDPTPSRHALRAVRSGTPAITPGDGPFASLVRLGERLLPGSVFVLDVGDTTGTYCWPAGLMGRRIPIDELVGELMRHYVGGTPLWLTRLSDHEPFAMLEQVGAAGPLAFACLPLGDHGGALFGVLRQEGPWTEEDRALVEDLASAFATECDRDRLRVHTAALIEESSHAVADRAPEPMASVAPLLTGVCHELNNPLTSIKSFAELLLLDARSEEDREALEIVQREAHRAARIVGDLRMVARQSAEASMQRELVDLNGVVKRVVDSRSREIRLEAVHLELQLDPTLPRVRAVRAHLEQAVSHLLSHAIESLTSRQGVRQILLGTSRTPRGVRLTARDNGRGIPAEHLGRIFDPFGDSPKQGSEGFQLGLSLVQSIIANHGGRVMARSRVERGTVIHIDLPTEGDAAGEFFAADDPPAGRGLRVLVADDEEPVRFSVARYLERRGHTVEQAVDGREALERITAGDQTFDIILADLSMPRMGGRGLLESLRERAYPAADRVILMSGEGCGSDGADDGDESVPLLQKPFELAEVAQVVEVHASLLAG